MSKKEIDQMVKDLKEGKEIGAIMDASSLVLMLEGDNTKRKPGVQMLKQLQSMQRKSKLFRIKVPTTQFLRAIYLCRPRKFDLNRLKQVMKIIELMPSPKTDYTNKQACRIEMMMILKIIGEKNGK